MMETKGGAVRWNDRPLVDVPRFSAAWGRSIWPQILDRRLDEAGVRAYRQEGELKATTDELGTRNKTSWNSRSCSGSSGPTVPPIKLLQRGPKMVRFDTESYKGGPPLYDS